jgi:L-iditol 2-dehydrogenase
MQVAFARGATEVTLTDVADERLEIGKRLGATRTLNVAEEPLDESGIEADVLIECSGNERALGEGIRRVRPAGVAVVVGMGPNEDARVPLAFVQTNEIILTGTFRYANTYPTAIDLAASGKVDLDAMVTSHYGLPETEEALQASGKDPANVKPMVIPNGT